MDKVTLIATSTFGLEAVVREELAGLGISETTVSDGKVEFRAELDQIPKFNLWLRAADRVLLKLAEFPAEDFDELFDRTKALDWERWLPKEAKITVTGKSVKSKLKSVRTNQSMVKKAILERLTSKYKIERFPESGAEFIIQIAVHKDTALLTLDTSGPGLHMRGYRSHKGDVPLRENLAAALVLLSFWNKDRLLVDPLCGSGTILIEAAMIGRNIAPGLNRTFASEHWPAINGQVWDEARREAKDKIAKGGATRILGYDREHERIRNCEKNAKNAGVGKDIIFKRQEIRNWRVEEDYGIVITNPPYGIKLSTERDIIPIYKMINKELAPRPGWSLYLITADKNFPEYFKRPKPSRTRKLYNGTIETNYYQYFGEKPPAEEES